MSRKSWIVLGALFSVYVVWSSTYLAIRFAVESMPPFLMAAVRFLIAGLILVSWQRWRGAPAPSSVEWRSAAIIGGFLLVGGNGGVVWAEQYVPSGIAALMVGATPLWMALLDALRPGGRKPAWLEALGLFAGFCGIVLLFDPFSSETYELNRYTVGLIVLLIAALLWAAGSLYSRSASLPESPLMGTGMEMMAGGFGLLVLSILSGEGELLDIAQITPHSWWGLIYLITFGSLVGFSAYTWLLRNAPTPIVSTYAYVNPLVAVFLGSILAAEIINSRIIISAAIIVGSVALITISRSIMKPLRPGAHVDPKKLKVD